jgi:hypothetical protein
MKSEDSKVYKGVSRAQPGAVVPYERPVAVYVPAQYVPGTAAPFIVVQDGQTYDAGADGNPRTDRAFIPPMLDNLIYEKRIPPIVAVLVAVGVLTIHLPIAGQHRMLNRLTQTRETATAWRFFESLQEKRILIVTDRPDLFTIMDYGAMSFEAARQDPFIFDAFARHLFYDIYVVQQISLSTGSPLPGYDIWPERRLETMLEYQNDADVLIRISRLGR